MNRTYTLVGTPFSTFTRTVALGLHYKGIPFQQVATAPQTDIAKAHHPFGFLPTLIIEGDNGTGETKPVQAQIRESQVIARFLDEIQPEPPLRIEPERGLILQMKMWEFVSFAACFGYPIVEVGVVKPRVRAMDEGKMTETDMRALTKEGVVKLQHFVEVMESLMVPTMTYAFSNRPTWADFFLFPLLADLRAVPEWDSVENDRILEWMKKMDDLPAVQVTQAGTLSVGARP